MQLVLTVHMRQLPGIASYSTPPPPQSSHAAPLKPTPGAFSPLCPPQVHHLWPIFQKIIWHDFARHETSAISGYYSVHSFREGHWKSSSWKPFSRFLSCRLLGLEFMSIGIDIFLSKALLPCVNCCLICGGSLFVWPCKMMYIEAFQGCNELIQVLQQSVHHSPLLHSPTPCTLFHFQPRE